MIIAPSNEGGTAPQNLIIDMREEPPIKSDLPTVGTSLRERMQVIERRDWWLWISAVLITLLLTGAVMSFGASALHMHRPEFSSAPLNDTILGLVALVLLFDIYTVYQHFQIQLVRKQLLEREELFR